MDRDFDLLATSVDVISVFVNLPVLKTTSPSAYETWMKAFSRNIDPSIHMSMKGRKARQEVLVASQKNQTVLQDVAVEIKTATNDNTINEAKLRLGEAHKMGAYNSHTYFFQCRYNDEVYSALVPSAHRVQVRHHAAVLGIRYVLYVKSSATGILYSVLVQCPDEILSRHRKELVTIVSLFAAFLYLKDGNL